MNDNDDDVHNYEFDDDDDGDPVFAGFKIVSDGTIPKSPATAMEHGHTVAFATLPSICYIHSA